MTSVLAHPVSVAEPPLQPVVIVATPAEREALATAYELVSVDRLEAEAIVTATGRGALLVEGRVTAHIVQTCVVSLAPVPATIDETFSVRFESGPRAGAVGVEVDLDVDAPDPPELIEGPNVDVGALIEETFALAIDPYPHAPGATLPPEASDGGDPAADSPFAALARLAQRPEGDK